MKKKKEKKSSDKNNKKKGWRMTWNTHTKRSINLDYPGFIYIQSTLKLTNLSSANGPIGTLISSLCCKSAGAFKSPCGPPCCNPIGPPNAPNGPANAPKPGIGCGGAPGIC